MMKRLISLGKQATSSAARHAQRACAVCGSRNIHYAFSLKEHRIVRCDNCGFMFFNPQPSNAVLSQIYSSNYFIALGKDGSDHVEYLKESTADRYLNALLGSDDVSSSTLLEIGCGRGEFLCRAAARGIKITGVELSEHACAEARSKLKEGQGDVIQGEIDVFAGQKEKFDYIVFCDVLEHVRDPHGFLRTVFNLLKPNGSMLCVVPSLDSWSARLLKTNWVGFKLEHLFYYNTKNLRSMLFQNGFSEFRHFPAKKTLSIDYIAGHFARHPVPFWSKLISIVSLILPQRLLRKTFPLTASGIGMIARKSPVPGHRRLSVVMPAFNEIGTVKSAIEKVLRKELQGVDIELVLIESNSTDGTREVVNQYKDHPRVKVILEQRPSGKGHAVRAGLQAATGDFVLIQDADDEYDIEDYDALIEPLLSGREAFVLGARHGKSSFKMRKFTDQPIRALVLNCGHWFFTSLINVLYGVWLKDPFTMYKVFRRDCIQDITFECNRFDFDHEFVIKLIRKGFKPVEIPVCYRSRSFAEGKKVRMFADPFTWIKAIIRYRFAKV
jgi:2-polyprenyl-3-methyl-5-hydroxy-6-metoxy-1,4-benzoquinol methylase/DNA-directed RNA polymerase subunit RPC12/RpoP